MIKEKQMTPRRMADLVAFALLFSGFGISVCNAQEASGLVKAVQLIGLTGVKENAKGTLKVENGNLHFVRGEANAEVSATSIQDVVTGADSEKAVGKTIGMISMAAPYGGGRFLSQFAKQGRKTCTIPGTPIRQDQGVGDPSRDDPIGRNQAACRIPGCPLREPHSPAREARKVSACLSRRRPQRHECRRSRCSPPLGPS